jgi:hypothetical protein
MCLQRQANSQRPVWQPGSMGTVSMPSNRAEGALHTPDRSSSELTDYERSIVRLLPPEQQDCVWASHMLRVVEGDRLEFISTLQSLESRGCIVIERRCHAPAGWAIRRNDNCLYLKQ